MILLLGMIVDGPKSVAVFGLERSAVHARRGSELSGFRVDDIRDKGVYLKRGGTLFFVRPGDTISEQIVPEIKIVSGLERLGDRLQVTTQLRDYVAKDGVLAIMNQAASEPVSEDGEQIGYRLLEIDKGSAFDLAGFKDGDVVTHIDGQPLATPFTALKLLLKIKEAESFTYRFRRGVATQTVKVEVR